MAKRDDPTEEEFSFLEFFSPGEWEADEGSSTPDSHPSNSVSFDDIEIDLVDLEESADLDQIGPEELRRSGEISDTATVTLEIGDSLPEAMEKFKSSTTSDKFLDVEDFTPDSVMQRTKMFMLLSETSSDPHFVKDLTLRYIYVNRAMERMLNRRRDSILGSTDRFLYRKRDAAELNNASCMVIQGSTSRMRSVRRIGGKRRVFIDTLIPWKDEQGKITGLYGSHVDITGSGETYDFSEIVDTEYPSRAMRETLEQALLVSKTRSTVLLLGESGCGKDFLARYIHDHSDRADGPFRSVNCAALPHELVESELFGHERGAFSGATNTKRGLVELANRGTLVLNEIGELPLVLQSKLLSFFDTRTFTRVGGEKEIKVDVRIIAATNRVLEKEVREGRFREDLLYRLNVFGIRVPPLRQRREDLPLLVSKLLPELAESVGRNPVPELESSAMEAILSNSWSGNVRELRNVLERALVRSADGRISVSDLDLDLDAYEDSVILNLDLTEIDDEEKGASEVSVFESTTKSVAEVPDCPTVEFEDTVVENESEPISQGGDIHSCLPNQPTATEESSRTTTSSSAGKPTQQELLILHQEYILDQGWSRAQLARHLGVDSSTLKKWFKQAGIEAGRAGRPKKKRTQ
jgi:PAS domain S-box-containing protein